jgi:PIN domain nuclease of toxin-antitoxin system
MYLLDTCALLWLVGDQARFSGTLREALTRAAGEIYVSSISAFEIGVKDRKGALELPMPASEWFPRAVDFHGLIALPVDAAIAAASTELPPLHADPCDRMIVATALQHELTVVTPDPLIAAYPGVRARW